jgi:hypothetical protein
VTHSEQLMAINGALSKSTKCWFVQETLKKLIR